MQAAVLELLQKERIAALTILIADNTPHAAALHFSHVAEPFQLIFTTSNESRKCSDLINNNSAKAAVVIGFSEVDWKTIQLEGNVRMLTDKAEAEKFSEVHYAKHPESRKFANDPDSVVLVFTPTWWRYSDLSVHPATIISA